MEIQLKYHFDQEFLNTLPGGRTGVAVHICRNEKTLVPFHSHDFHELSIISGGQGVYMDEAGNQYDLKAGNVFLLLPGMIHRYIRQQNMTVLNVLWQSELMALNLRDLPETPGYHALFELEPKTRSSHHLRGALELNADQLTEVRILIERMQREIQHNQSGVRLATAAMLSELFVLLCRAYAAGGSHDRSELLRIDRVIAHINTNFKNTITRQQLAKIAGMGESTFYRTFRRIKGMSPTEYISEIRLKAAERLLLESDKTLSEIALACGFSDGNYFGLCFKRQYGQTPHCFRKKR